MAKNVGAKKLMEWMNEKGVKARFVANSCGVSHFSIYSWRAGNYVPAKPNRIHLENLTDGYIKQDDWDVAV